MPAEIRERDWCNVVTCHMDTPRAYVWRLQNFALGEHILTPSAENQKPIKACAISSCGNFAFLGTEDGWIERFNLQSGLSRGVYLDPSEDRNGAHSSEVVGLACNATNATLISAGYHGDIKVNSHLNTFHFLISFLKFSFFYSLEQIWNFKRCSLEFRLDVGHSVTKIVYHRTNGRFTFFCLNIDLISKFFHVRYLKIVLLLQGS